MDKYQEYIALSRYARWLPAEGRRETWEETVDRWIGFWDEECENAGWPENARQAYVEAREGLRDAVLGLEVMPSMRSLMTAGEALKRDHVAGYNCAYLPVDSPRSFDEAMYILMCGTGVGFSVEDQHVSKLPPIPESFEHTDSTIVVADSKSGWQRALRALLAMLCPWRIP